MKEKKQSKIQIDIIRLRSLKGKQKLYFLWDYYKIQFFALLLVFLFIGYSIGYQITKGNTVLYAVLINAQEQADIDIWQDFIQYSEITNDKAEVDVEPNYTLNLLDAQQSDFETIQVLAALFGIGDMDIFVASQDIFERYTQQDAFENIGVLLSEELKEQYADKLYYYENSSGATIVGGVIIGSHSPLHKAGYYSQEVVIGIATQAENLELALSCIEWILST